MARLHGLQANHVSSSRAMAREGKLVILAPEDHDLPAAPGTDHGRHQAGGLPQGLFGLSALAKNELRKEPSTGMVFVLCAKRAVWLKLFYWDGTAL
jgi:hypothetical protein